MNNLKVKSDNRLVTTEQPFVFPMAPSQCGQPVPIKLPGLDQVFVHGSVETLVGKVPKISSDLTPADHWGSIKARWGVGRMQFMVDPGLYALEEPDENSNVLVTANYKMSFDHLRRELAGQNAWILVLDTRGINVWCAAGKGTFSTDQILEQIETCRLSKVVAHKNLILPQLGAPGVAAHKVRKISGFKVNYGPVLARDLHEFINNGLKAPDTMRQKTFTTRERLILVPVELVASLKKALVIIPIFFILSGLAASVFFSNESLAHGSLAVSAVLGSVLSGAILTPLLLPWLPGRAFALKGMWMGLLLFVILAASWYPKELNQINWIEILAWGFMLPAASAYMGMNFTGASTFTSLSGVKKEMRWAIPLEITAGMAGISLWMASQFFI